MSSRLAAPGPTGLTGKRVVAANGRCDPVVTAGQIIAVNHSTAGSRRPYQRVASRGRRPATAPTAMHRRIRQDGSRRPMIHQRVRVEDRPSSPRRCSSTAARQALFATPMPPGLEPCAELSDQGGPSGPPRVGAGVTAPTTTFVVRARSTQTTIAWKMVMAVTRVSSWVRAAAHVRELDGVRRPRRLQRLRRAPAHSGRADAADSGFLWVLRIVLIVALVLHVWAAVKLLLRVRRARTVRIRSRRTCVHIVLADDALGWVGAAGVRGLASDQLHHRQGQRGKRSDERSVQPAGGQLLDLVADRHLPVAMVALGTHLLHGVWSAAQTLGVTNNARARRNAKVGGVVAAVVIAGGSRWSRSSSWPA